MDFLESLAGGAVKGIFNLIGGGLSTNSSNNAQKREYQRQKEFAQNGVSWRVADAERSGIHPLAALGAQVTSYSPQAAVGSDYGLSGFGQSIGDSIKDYANRPASPSSFDKWYDKTTKLLTTRNMDLQNQEIQQRMELDRMEASRNALSHQPGNPISLGGKSTGPKNYSSPSNKAPKPGPVNQGANLFEFGQTEREGVWRLLPTNDYAQKFEDKLILEYTPFLDAWRAGGFQGKQLQGMIYSPLHLGWIRSDGDLAIDLLNYLREKEERKRRKSQEILERH